ncbi:DUF4190 domain-containing protein, partial [Actinomadura sp. KC345]|uniref:DUF4190 domain-containing protein n=1 Tax=Actinomadura sp. KC345 TaxID=2530371 RepID=UPI001049D043
LPPMPVGPGYGPPPGPGTGKTNGLAIAAFVTGLLGCLGILGIVLGVISLGQIKSRREGGRGFAIAGIVLSCLWIMVGAVGFALSAASSDDAGGSPSAVQTRPDEVEAKKMKVGDCIDDDQGAASGGDGPVEVDSVKIVPCTQPHDGEVMAVFRLSNATMPSDRELVAIASAGCRQRMAGKLDRDPAVGRLATYYYYPTPGSWRQGDRAVTCVAVASDEGTKLTRKLRT